MPHTLVMHQYTAARTTNKKINTVHTVFGWPVNCAVTGCLLTTLWSNHEKTTQIALACAMSIGALAPTLAQAELSYNVGIVSGIPPNP